MDNFLNNYAGQTSIQAILVYSIIGTAIGLTVDNVNKKVSIAIPDLNRNKWIRALIKLIILGVTLLSVHRMFPSFASDWQSTTPGLFFVSFVFGLQSDLMSSLSQLNQ